MGQRERLRLCAWATALLLCAGRPANATEATLVGDAHVSSSRPAVNAGSLSNLNVGSGYSTLVRFDLGLLPAGTTAAQVSRAVLRLYVNRMDTAGTVTVQAVNGAWDESTVTYATMPGLEGMGQIVAVGQAGAYVAVDVTAQVQSWVSSPATNYGLALTSGSAVLQFDSKENDLTAHPAALDVTIVSSGPAGSAGAAGAAGPIGLTGPAGPVGAQGPAGSGGGGLQYQGSYSAGASYGMNDVVLYGSSSYVSLMAGNHGNTPGVGVQWAVLAEGGTGVGPTGPAGPQGPPGTAGLGYAGSYASTRNYAMSDVVGFAGSSYISLANGNVGNTPGQSLSAWGLLAQGGTGAQGPAGVAGVQGPPGSTGAQGAPGPVGAAGASGVAGPQGAPGLKYQGAYQSTVNYALGDVTLWQGATYSSLAAGNHGNTPDASPAYWGVLSQRGATGGVGATGAVGAAGPQGLPGSVGPPGDRGAQGMQGIAGQAGAQGLTGAAGAQGLSGPAGPQGAAGPVGLAYRGPYQSTVNYALADGVSWQGSSYVSSIAGNAGNTPGQSPAAWALFAAAGAPGVGGVVGPVGPAGVVGSAGVAGPQGVPGIAGATGPQGPAVVNYLGNYDSTTNYALRDGVSFGGSTYVSMVAGNHGNTPGQTVGSWTVLAGQGLPGAVGAVGPAGPSGTAGAAGAVGPQGVAGPPTTFAGGWLTGTAYAVGTAVSYGGSSYVALTANAGRQPDISPQAWGLQVQAGAQGPAGPAGASGTQGSTGYPGPPGLTGATGPAGPVGSTGPVGPAGAQGLAGPVGPQGTAGAAGLNYRGNYAPATTYALNDGVSYGGATYLSLTGLNHANEPDISPGSWGLLAQGGATGPAGATGAIGAQGVPGPTGATGAAGTAGTPGATGVSYRGAWSAVTTYQVRDAVLFGGTSYYATASTTGLQPDLYPAAWSVLAQSGGAGPSGAAATVGVGNVTTGAAGSHASVTNRGTSTAAILDFTIPQGAAGVGGGGGGGTAQSLSGLPYLSTYHAVSYNSVYYAVNGAGAAFGEVPGVLTWVPGSCTANRLVVFSQQQNTITVTLRLGSTPGTMADTGLACSVAPGTSCTGTGSVAITAGSFVDLGVAGASGNAAGVWTALECD